MSAAPAHPRAAVPAWSDVVDQAAAFVTTEYASLTRAGAPVTWPVTPYLGTDGRTIDVSTGLTYPLKAERARRNPKVAASFSYPAGSGLAEPATFVVQGLATVRDADLVATSARYLRASSERFPAMFRKIPTPVLRRMDWYWTRMWVEITPTRVLWWAGGDLDRPPVELLAPDGVDVAPSDPPPSGPAPGSWRTDPPVPWRDRARGAIDRLGMPVLTTVTSDGWPLPLRARAAEETADGYVVVPPAGAPVADGPAFVSFHTHGEVFDGQENVGLAGRCEVRGDEVHVTVDRALSDFGMPRGAAKGTLAILRAGRALRPRLAAEARRRGQRLPTLDQLGVRR